MWRTLFSSGGGGLQYRSALRQGPVSPPRSPPQRGRARHLSPPRSGCAAVDDPLGDVGETSKPNRREATHMAYLACEALVMAHMETNATHMAYLACEAVVMALMGSEATHMAYLAFDALEMAHMATLKVTKWCEATHDGFNARGCSRSFPCSGSGKKSSWVQSNCMGLLKCRGSYSTQMLRGHQGELWQSVCHVAKTTFLNYMQMCPA